MSKCKVTKALITVIQSEFLQQANYSHTPQIESRNLTQHASMFPFNVLHDFSILSPEEGKYLVPQIPEGPRKTVSKNDRIIVMLVNKNSVEKKE